MKSLKIHCVTIIDIIVDFLTNSEPIKRPLMSSDGSPQSSRNLCHR